jgi:hypothetical protein
VPEGNIAMPPFVGRKRELDIFRSMFEPETDTRILSIYGKAGIGENTAGSRNAQDCVSGIF